MGVHWNCYLYTNKYMCVFTPQVVLMILSSKLVVTCNTFISWTSLFDKNSEHPKLPLLEIFAFGNFNFSLQGTQKFLNLIIKPGRQRYYKTLQLLSKFIAYLFKDYKPPIVAIRRISYGDLTRHCTVFHFFSYHSFEIFNFKLFKGGSK